MTSCGKATPGEEAPARDSTVVTPVSADSSWVVISQTTFRGGKLELV
jgi:hypothetical protein